ncbi:glutamine--fructose-6-phosphate transaminase (isomerizing) [Pseudochrobactrum kiredjianiae]|uniref:Glutamine--fructose-6-phosphate aminotransferase [isomerizing] n=1 Tax=Pseudochrobactrum kiredjianiae TaxID=386305 RepID=A0ABW3V243_9HYPH|nr:glutamine--fructose-6-phosphate transaminase (isomerizing) [Pseudochrobactrum kiredjianiae]MDM7852509.1 glutamine--fructose-6-phosphate transaminase (isomerizing) [Pseudochrobactrum kiredjianiae]
MCGIIGIISKQPISSMVLEALKLLEYRGYDSAGIATLVDGDIERRRAEGKLVNLEKRVNAEPLSGTIGIGHTRWATHGAPTERNAHPHATEQVAIVHNGIIENFAELRAELEAEGIKFQSDTDTETVAQLVSRNIRTGDAPIEAVRKVFDRLRGAFALAFLFKGEDDLLIAARRGSPLAIGYGEGEMFLGSDAIALAPFTDKITYLEDGDWAVLTRDSVTFYDENNAQVSRIVQQSAGAAYVVNKGNYKHFMEKEIYEQPEVISRTLAHYLDFASSSVREDVTNIDWSQINRLAISACGTAYYAATIGKYWLERYARLPVEIDIASEFRYREMPLSKDTLALFVSQSGETADTLASLRYCRAQGLPIAAVVNVRESTIAREADIVLPTLAGPEIGVASTKAFTCQLSVLAALALSAAKAKGTITPQKEQQLVQELASLSGYINQALKLAPKVEAICRDLVNVKHALYLGRGTSFPLAMEGALKLKEISYIHAEGYAAGELKHGPIALIDETMPVIVIAPYDRLYEKTVSNMQEVAARGGRIILITDAEGAKHANVHAVATLTMPEVPEFISPLVYALPIQMLAYYTAVFMGTDIDQPRNLAKSVTVE